ncbi:MAG TPA: redoxin domain-containing protein, partial [Candidatus Ozemobacteraceae bacterium]|nr:redoxin domain-containing protein [Candidatus Ozemobacteraceae bacterium]
MKKRIARALLGAGVAAGLMMCAPMATNAAESKDPTSMVNIGGEAAAAVEPEIELKVGDPAPEFSLPNLVTDKMESLKDYAGKPLILFFIQSACYSCLQEAKALKTLKEQN